MFDGKKGDVCWIPGKDSDGKFQPQKIVIKEENPLGYVYSKWDRVGETLLLIKRQYCFATKKELVIEEMIRVCQLSIKKKVDLDAEYVKEIDSLKKHLEES